MSRVSHRRVLKAFVIVIPKEGLREWWWHDSDVRIGLGLSQKKKTIGRGGEEIPVGVVSRIQFLVRGQC